MSQTSDGAVRSASLSPERLAAKHQQVLLGDYFQILEVGRDADGFAIARAVAALTREFNLEQIGSLSAEEQVKLRLVAAILQDAACVLGDAGLRVDYARHARLKR